VVGAGAEACLRLEAKVSFGDTHITQKAEDFGLSRGLKLTLMDAAKKKRPAHHEDYEADCKLVRKKERRAGIFEKGSHAPLLKKKRGEDILHPPLQKA